MPGNPGRHSESGDLQVDFPRTQQGKEDSALSTQQTPQQGECLTLPDLPQQGGHLPVCTLATRDHTTPTAPTVPLPSRTGPHCALADCDNQDTEKID